MICSVDMAVVDLPNADAVLQWKDMDATAKTELHVRAFSKKHRDHITEMKQMIGKVSEGDSDVTVASWV